MSLDRFQFKLLLAFLMLLDHIYYFIPEELAIAFKIISRCVAVCFAYLAVEGFLYTSNVKKYLFRLYAFAIFMQIGNYIFNKLYYPNVNISNSIMMTLALGVSLLLVYRDVHNFFIRTALIIAIFFASNYFEGGFIILIFMFFSYIYKDDKPKRNISYFIIAGILFIFSFLYAMNTDRFLYNMLKYPNYLIITIIPLLKIYNGKSGAKNIFSKYFFYIFYPLHLWIIASIEYFL